MPRPAKNAKLRAGEITYESLFGRDTKVNKSTTNDDGKSDLSQCTNNDCKILEIAAVSTSFPKNRQSLPITKPILVPLWHEPSNDDSTEKTMYYVRGTDVDLNKLDENGLAGGSDSEPQIVYKVVPNTHAHVVRYVMAEDDEAINEKEILEVVDISKDRRRLARLTGKSNSINVTRTRNIDDDVVSFTNIKTEKRDKALIETSTSQQLTTSLVSNQLKENTKLKEKCRVLELKCKWSDQKMAEMQSEMKKLKEEMMVIQQIQNPSTVVARKEGQRKPEQYKIFENQHIKEETAWEEDNDAEYLDVMMLDEEYVDEDDSQ